MNDLQPAIDCLKVRLFQINSAIQALEGLEEFREKHKVNPPAAGAHPHGKGSRIPSMQRSRRSRMETQDLAAAIEDLRKRQLRGV